MLFHKTAKYFKIETWSNNDGPGTRLVIFLQSCYYRCLYCHNPESWTSHCASTKKISVDQIIKIYQKYKEFYSLHGGITLSGGEPLIQAKFVYCLAKKCHRKKIHLTIDTSACCFDPIMSRWYKKLIKYVDLWMVDIKAIDQELHQKITKIRRPRELDFIDFLEKKQCEYWIRYVLVKNLNDSDQNLFDLGHYISRLKHMKKMEVLPYHNLAIKKYEQLKIDYPLVNAKIMSPQEIRDCLLKIEQTYREDHNNV